MLRRLLPFAAFCLACGARTGALDDATSPWVHAGTATGAGGAAAGGGSGGVEGPAFNEVDPPPSASPTTLLNPFLRQRTRAEWTERLRSVKLPCGPERDYAEVTTDAELLTRGMLYRLPAGDGASLQVRMPLEFTTTERVRPEPPPALPKREAA